MNKIKVVKRDSRTKDFSITRIKEAIHKAYLDVDDELTFCVEYDSLEAKILSNINKLNKSEITVEEIQDIIIGNLQLTNKKVAKGYEEYRKRRTLERDKKSDLMSKIHAVGIETDRDNANVGNNFSSKLLRIASESNKWHNLANMPEHLTKAHTIGELYFHDLDSYNLTTNCLHIPTGKILNKGFNTGYGTINKPNSIETAGELSCILLQSTQNDMFGGQSHPNFDNDLGEYVDITRRKIKEDFPNESKETIEGKLRKRIHQAMQGIVYNLNTMHSRAGSQVPFSSVNIGLPKNKDEALVCEIFLLEYEKGLGKGEQPIFPNIIFRVKDGVNREEGNPYYYLYEIACRVASKRMNPTFMNIDADFNKEYYDKGINPATMG